MAGGEEGGHIITIWYWAHLFGHLGKELWAQDSVPFFHDCPYTSEQLAIAICWEKLIGAKLFSPLCGSLFICYFIVFWIVTSFWLLSDK